MCVCVRAFPSDGIYACARVRRVCVCVCARARTLMARRRRAVFIARPHGGACGRARAFCVWCHWPSSRALAAGVTWTSRTTSAPWAGREQHTSVIDAAGAIYVIGGFNNGGDTKFNDVWASTDGGARPAMARWGLGPVVFIARPARAGAGAVWGHRPGSRALAAGVTWRSRTTSAPWAAREGHTSVVDAAGAIYVIGGMGGTYPDDIFYQDVWVSTNGGARPDSVGGVFGGYCWVLRGDSVVPWGTTGVLGVLGGTQGIIRSTTGYYRSTQE
jgi:hypothetical protein